MTAAVATDDAVHLLPPPPLAADLEDPAIHSSPVSAG